MNLWHWIGHLQVANESGAASATLTAASSGPIPKAPGSAGDTYSLPPHSGGTKAGFARHALSRLASQPPRRRQPLQAR